MNKYIGWIVGIIWFLIIVAGAALVMAFLYLRATAPVIPTLIPIPPTKTITTTPTITPSPTPVPPTPTLTPLPTYTPRPSPTPVPTEATPSFQEGPIVIGYSVRGRPLEVWRYGWGEDVYLVVFGIHGGYEANTVALADELLDFISNHHAAIPGNATIYILRALNPDGLTHFNTVEGRPNLNGVDLNRNFPSDSWSSALDAEGCAVYGQLSGGEFAGSEPETQALMEFIDQIDPQAIISYHSAGPGLYPALDTASVDLAAHLAARTYYPYPGPPVACPPTGTLADYASALGIAAIDVELTDHAQTEFQRNLDLVISLMQWKAETIP